MAVKKVRVHGNVRWRARVVFRGLQKVAYCPTKEAAKRREVEFYQDLRKDAEQADQTGHQPATLRTLLDLYVADLEFRQKPSETVGRARDTLKTIGRVLPELVERPVSAIGDDDVWSFIATRERAVKAEVVAGKRVARRTPHAPARPIAT